METQLSAGIVRLRSADLNIPEADSCGEAVEAVLIPLIAEEKRVVIPRGRSKLAYGVWKDPLSRILATHFEWGRSRRAEL